MEILRKNCLAIITWLFLFTPQVNYNHGQKSWDTCLSGAFSNYSHRCNPAPLTPQTMLDPCLQNFFGLSALYRVGRGRTARKFQKGCTVLRGNRQMTKKYEYCCTVSRTFVQDCSLSQNLLCTMVLSKQKEGVAWLSKGQLNLRFYSALTFMIFFGLTKYYKMQKDYM